MLLSPVKIIDQDTGGELFRIGFRLRFRVIDQGAGGELSRIRFRLR